eukprot:SAG22_NODE_48_length_24654_cov_4.406394_22_plen_477_part_00
MSLLAACRWPLYKMYANMILPVHRLRSEVHFTHDGATVPETVSWYGTRRANDIGPWQNYAGMGRMPLWFHANSAVRNHFACSLELTFMALQHWRFAAERDRPVIAREVIEPLGLDVVTWYSKHYMLGGVNNAVFGDPARNTSECVEERLLQCEVPSDIPVITPAQSLEAYQDCVNPVVDVAGLLAIVPALVKSQNENHINASSEQQAQLRYLSSHLAALPLGVPSQLNNCNDTGARSLNNCSAPSAEDAVVLAAYNCSGGTGSGAVGFKPGGPEAPMMYPWFPFRLFGAGRDNVWSPTAPPLSLARANALGGATYKVRGVFGGPWDQGLLNSVLTQQPIADQAAMLVERAQLGFAPKKRFPFAVGDCAGSGANSELGAINSHALQLMISQDGADGSIVMFPGGWLASWQLTFKLHTQNDTTIEGRCAGSKLTEFVVTPPSRMHDVTFGALNTGCVPTEVLLATIAHKIVQMDEGQN